MVGNIDAGPDEEFSNSVQSLQSDEMTRKDKVGRSILATFIAALGPLSFGYCLGYSSSALVDLKKDNVDSALRLTVDQGSWFSVSLFCFFLLLLLLLFFFFFS